MHVFFKNTNRRTRRGAAYVMVLCTGLLLSVISLGVLAASRSTAQSLTQSGDLAEAATLAEAGVEWGLAAVKADTAWRTTYTSGTAVTARTLGRGTVSFKITDETDGILSNNTTDAARLSGIGRAGSAVRVVSVLLTGSGGSLDSLKNAAQSSTNVTVTSGVTVSGGALSSNAAMTVQSGATVTGDVEANSLTVSGSVTGSRTTLSSSRTLPNSSVFDTYKALATEITFASISSGTVQNKVISSASNPYGTANSSGVYYIKVPSNGTLTIRSSRLVATLIVELDAGGKLTTAQSFAWDPPRTDYPSLIIKGSSSSSTVTLNATTTALSELSATTNFNPTGTPNSSGQTDNDMTDTYPTEFHGVLHVIGSPLQVTVGSSFTLKGALLSEAPLSVGGSAKFIADPTLSTNPPVGYTATTTMIPSPATWRWDAGT